MVIYKAFPFTPQSGGGPIPYLDGRSPNKERKTTNPALVNRVITLLPLTTVMDHRIMCVDVNTQADI